MTTIDERTPVHLRGNGRPVAEERTLTDLKVTGTIPRPSSTAATSATAPIRSAA